MGKWAGSGARERGCGRLVALILAVLLAGGLMLPTLAWAQDPAPQPDGAGSSGNEDGDSGGEGEGEGGAVSGGGTFEGGKYEFSIGGAGSPGESVVSPGEGGGSPSPGEGGGTPDEGGGTAPGPSSGSADSPLSPEAKPPPERTVRGPGPVRVPDPSGVPSEPQATASDAVPTDASVSGGPLEGAPPALSPALFDLLGDGGLSSLADQRDTEDDLGVGNGLTSGVRQAMRGQSGPGDPEWLSAVFWLVQVSLIGALGMYFVARQHRPALALHWPSGVRLFAELRRRLRL